MRGRVLGGTSMINAGFYSQADKEFFSEMGIKWDMDSVEKAYEWVEETIVSQLRLPLWQSAVKEALLEAGVGPDNKFNLNHKLGTKFAGSTTTKNVYYYGACTEAP
ncbi:Glucose-methanol-choline oxidoreductase, N-terminal [Parasponia andersonii]|uniref:Glucose-methanol-choline oxidoreductase, N-terminal n=1 Tax=Parasponia andersonii TaxID=3476 RepID=A0A2P5APY1_PARAD|nr:Glucose-methanol-choline oxidoreductase, N-terminal [Parasponia andersonii]